MASFRSRKNQTHFISGIGIAVICAVIAGLALIFLPGDDPRIVRMRQLSLDIASPVMMLLSLPVVKLRKARQRATDILELQKKNDLLHAENEEFREQLDELTRTRLLLSQYRNLLALPKEPDLAMANARVVADMSSPFVKTLLANTGRIAGVGAGQAVMGKNGLIGRVLSSGDVSSRILLVTDLNSHIPVIALSSDARAIMSGQNTQHPRLGFLPRAVRLKEGDLIITSGDGGDIPIGLPIGLVAFEKDGQPYVQLNENLDQLMYVRVVLSERRILPPERNTSLSRSSQEKP